MATLLDLPELATSRLGRLAYHESDVDSTQDRLKERLAGGGAVDGTLLLADRQHKGRGRLGRVWKDLPGRQIFASLLITPDLPISRWPLVSLVAGVALAKALEQMGVTDVGLKWPNDIFLGQKKVAGILSEVVSSPAGRASIVLGIGVNCEGERSDFPNELRDIATTLSAEGVFIGRLELLSQWLTLLENDLEELRNGSETLIREFTKRWIHRGQPIRVASGVTQLEGQAESIDPDGALRLKTSTGPRRVLAGDVGLL